MALAGRHDEALRTVDAALKLEPGNEKAWLTRARALAWSGRHHRALAIYDRYLSSDPARADLRLERASVEGWSGNKLQSEKFLLAVLAQEPGNVNAHLALADMHYWLGDWHEARKHYAAASSESGLRRLREGRRPGAAAAPAYFSSSRGLRRASGEARLWTRVLDRLELGGLYRREALRQSGFSTLESDVGGLALQWWEGLRWQAGAEAYARAYDSGPAVGGGAARLAFQVFDQTRVRVGWERGDPGGRFDESTVETARRRIQLDDAFAAVSAQPWKLRLAGEARYGSYVRSPNERRSAEGRVLFKAAPWLDAGYEGHWHDARRPDPLYFSPGGYVSHGIQARLHHEADGLRAELSNSVFYQPEGRAWGESSRFSVSLARGRAEAGLDAYYIVSDVRKGPRYVSRHLSARLSCRF